MVTTSQDTKPIKTAVITGHHPFDVPGFYAMFRSMTGIDFYIQSIDDFVSDWGKVFNWYDVLLFYHFHQETPSGEEEWWEKGKKEALERLGERKQGIVLMHHALLAFPEWDLWSELCGIHMRSFGYYLDQTISINIVKHNHPITRDLNSWKMIDETYIMSNAGEDSEILLTTDHSLSMETIAWTRQYKNANVFCLQSGHDGNTYSNKNFQTVLFRGIKWVAGRV